MRIFLSYGHDEHAALAVRIKCDLEARRHEAWFDLDRLKPAGDWERYIEEGLDWASASPGEGRFVLLMTPHSVRRPKGYCLNELARAWDRNLPIIPIMVAKVEPPLSIGRIQYLDMSDCVPVDDCEERYKSKFEQLLDAIENDRVDFEGAVQARLLNYLAPLTYEAELSQHLIRFRGRDWVLKEFESWLVDTRRRVFWIIGEAGVGKSAMAAWLAARRPEVVAFHACHYGNSDRVNPRKALASIAYQLSTQLPDYQQRLNASNLDALKGADAGAVFERLFIEPLGGLPAPINPVVILIDALDEATQNGKNELASIIGTQLRKTPPWLRLIVTSRPHEEAVRFPLQGLDPWELDTRRADNLEDIRSYLHVELRPFSENDEPSRETVDTIIEKSEGLFLYVNWVRQELADGRFTIKDVGEFPQGLGGIYASFFERGFPDLEKYATAYRPVLEVICAAREPLELDFLDHLFEWRVYGKKEITKAFGSLFPVAGGRIRPFHRSVRDWLTEETRAGDYFASVEEGHKRLAAYGWRRHGEGVAQMEQYSLLHLPAHLAACGRKNELQRLLLDFPWIAAKLEAADISALIADYDTASDSETHLVQGALKLSMHVLANDKNQLAGQLIGRLLSSDRGSIRRLYAAAHPPGRSAWLKPTSPTLVVPGGALLRTFAGHQHAVDAVAVDAAGLRVLSGSDDDTAKLWDLRTGNLLCTLEGHDGWILAVAFTPNDNRAVTGSADGTVKIWDIRTGTLLQTLEWEEDLGRIHAVSVTFDGRRLVSGSNFGYLAVWDLTTGSLSYLMEEVGVHALALTPDDRYVLSASEDNVVLQWDLNSGELVRVLRGHQDRVRDVVVTPEGHCAISVSEDGAVKIWDLETGKEVRTIEPGTGALHAVAVTSDGRYAVAGGNSGDLTLWNLQSGELVRRVGKAPGSINAIAIVPNSRFAFVGSYPCSLTMWDLEATQSLTTVPAHRSSINAVEISDGTEAVSCSCELTIKRWDLKSHKLLETVSPAQNNVAQLCITPDAQTAFSGSGDGIVRAYDLRSNTLLFELKTGDGVFVRALAVTPNGNTGASAFSDGTIRLWNLRTGALLGQAELEPTRAYSVDITPDSRRLIAGCEDGIVRLWDLQSASLTELSGHKDAVSKVAFSPDGSHAVTASTGVLKLWDLTSGVLVHHMEAPNSTSWCVAITSGGRWILSGYGDNTLRLWNRTDSRCLDTFTTEDIVSACAITDDGTHIMAGDYKGRVYFFDLVESPNFSS